MSLPERGSVFATVDAKAWDNKDNVISLGITQDVLTKLKTNQQKTAIAQFFGIVQPSMIMAEHVFSGLKRGLWFDGDLDGDKKFVVYSWKQTWDYQWVGTPAEGRPDPRLPPPDRIFAVLVRCQPVNNVAGTIEHWTWVREAPDKPGAPIDWRNRYDSVLWD